MNPQYLVDEMTRVGQDKIIEPDELAKRILDDYTAYPTGGTIEIKEL